MKQKVPMGGKMHEGETVDIVSATEHWNQYLLKDGTLLKAKLVVSDVIKIDGLTDDQGNIVYAIKSSNVLTVIPPE